MFSTVLFLAVAHACASHVGGSTPAPAPMFKVLFRALKTGVLEVSEGSDAGWLKYYDISLTEESISRFESLMFTESTDALQHSSEETILGPGGALTARGDEQTEAHANVPPRSRTATGLQDALVKMVKGGTDREIACLSSLLAKYAVYKAWLHNRLCPAGLRMLEAAFSENPETLRFINRLARVRRRSDILTAFADGWDINVVNTIWIIWDYGEPQVITAIIKEYVENHDDPVKIPFHFFKELSLECQYRLAMKLADLRPYYGEIDWYSFYVLSRFSAHPSERIRALCLKENAQFLNYEGDRASESSRSSTYMEKFDPYLLPQDVWFKILFHLDELSQIYIVPGVHRLWRDLGSKMLNKSLETHVGRAKKLNGPAKWKRILDNECYPWNRLSSSRVASFKWLVSQANGQTASTKADRRIKAMWDLLCHDIGEGWITVSHESYLDLYVRCCNAIEDPPQFRQLPGMSDEEYAALMESLVGQYKIIPNVAWAFPDDPYGIFVRMVERHGDLVILLLGDDELLYSRLVSHLFSTRTPISPEMDRILAEKSPFYRLLLNRRSKLGECFDIVPHGFTTSWYRPEVHSVVDLCLLLRPKSDSAMLRFIKEAILKCCRGLQANQQMAYRELKRLGVDVLWFLHHNCKSYSIEELGTVERVLEECQVYGKDEDGQVMFECHFGSFIRNPKFTIELIR